MSKENKPPSKKPEELTLQLFAKRLAAKNAELLSAFVLGLDSGELSLDLENAEAWIDSEVDQWCDTEQPKREMHLRMVSALFVWMLVDEMYAEDVSEDAEDEESPMSQAEEAAQHVQRAAKLSVEVIQTVRSIWGIIHGKAT